MSSSSTEKKPERHLHFGIFNTIRRYTDIPPFLYILGFLVIFVGVFYQSQVRIIPDYEYIEDGSYPINRQLFPKKWPAKVREWLHERGKLQAKFYREKYNETQEDHSLSKKRIDGFKDELKNAGSSTFLSSREKYDEEKVVFKALEKKLKKFKLSSPTPEDCLKMLGVFSLTLGIFLAASFCLYRLSRSHIAKAVELRSWKAPYLSFLVSSYACLTAVVFYTSIYTDQKFWFGQSSFHVSWQSWCWERVVVLGMCILTSIPLTQLWCYLRKEFVPEISSDWLLSPNNNSAVEKYIQYLQIWTIVIFYVFSIITIAAVRWAASYQDQFENAYFLITAFGVMVSGLLIGKMIRNAMVLRGRYHEAISKNFSSRKELKNSEVPDDPTLGFIGASWWKLPANFVGIATAMWAMLKFTGVSNLILDAVK